MAIVLINGLNTRQTWEAIFRRQIAESYPDRDLRVWPDYGDPADVRHAVVAFPDHGALARFPNLIAIHSLWAGVERIVLDPDLPKGVPIIRMVDHGLTQGMVDYMTGHAYRYHLDIDRFQVAQRTGIWDKYVPPLVDERIVGVMGLGEIGVKVAENLVACGFQVHGWSRSRKTHPDIRCFSGEESLAAFLPEIEILLLLLPNTPRTRRIVDAGLLAALPKGAAIVNAGRGELIDDEALLAALDSGHVSGATLDVFHTEPLPATHPFWRHGKVLITPHIAAETRLESGTATVLENIDYLEKGGDVSALRGVYSPEQGY